MPAPKCLSTQEVQALLNHLSPNGYAGYARRAAVRNVAIAELMLEAGCRAQELCHLLLSDAFWQGTIRSHLQIRNEIAKYHAGGMIPMSDPLAAALTALRDEYHAGQDGSSPRYLVYASTPSQPLCRRQVHRIIAVAGLAALGRPIYPHMLRHTFGDVLSQVADTSTLQTLMRHLHLSSTQIYTHATSARQATAIARAAELKKGAMIV